MPPAPLGWGWLHVVLSIVLCLLAAGVVVGGILVAVHLTGASMDEPWVSAAMYSVGFVAYGGLLLGVYLFAVRRSGWTAVGVVRVPLSAYAWVLPAYFLGSIVAGLLSALVGKLTGSFENPQVDAMRGSDGLSWGAFIAVFVLAAVVAPIVEELFFRGMIYPLLRRRFGPVVTIVLNALLFSVLHFIPILVPALFAVGVMMAWLRERFQGIGPSIAYHVTQNAMALLMMRQTLMAEETAS